MVDVVVNLLEQGDEPLVVDDFVFVGQCFGRAEFFEDVIHASEREFWMLGLACFAVRVELLAKVGEAGF